MAGKLLVHLRNQWIGVLALLLVLTGGTAYALDGTNTVFTDDIVNDQVKSADVRNDDLTRGGLAALDLRPGSVRGSEVLDNSLSGGDVADAPNGSDAVNANRLDGRSASYFAPAAAARSVGPSSVDDPVGGGPTTATLFTVGPVTVSSECEDFGANRYVTIVLSTSEDGGHFSALRTFGSGVDSTDVFEGNLRLGDRYAVAYISAASIGRMGQSFLTVLTPGGQARTASLYLGANILSSDCVFGYSLFAR